MDKMPERPPYIRFEVRPVEDREATQKNGVVSYRDEDFILVTPAGSKDVHEAVAAEWLQKSEREAKNGRIPLAWVQYFREAYAAWKRDEEPPVSGTRLSHWPGLNKPQYEQLRALKLLTIEDVAAMNEETIGRLGMGGRAMKAKAQAFLDAKTGPGQLAEQISSLTAENEALRMRADAQATQIAELVKTVDALKGTRTPASAAVSL